jgi:hypothetical protein
MRYGCLSEKVEERRRLGNVTSSGYRRETSKLRPEKPKARNLGNEDVRGPRSCKANTYSLSYGYLASRDAQSERRDKYGNW